MDTIEAIILGIIQGLTEFLPVSSSGHIELGKAVMDVPKDVDGLAFTILVHVATALSSVIIFRKAIFSILGGILSTKRNEYHDFALKIILSAIPVGVIGIIFKDHIDALFQGNIVFVGAMLLVTAGILFLTMRTPSGTKAVGWKEAIGMGLAQTIAVLPGISRAGSTISTALIMGVDREKAAEFSFIMVLVPIFGKALLDVKDVIEDPTLWELPMNITIAGFVAAFLSGLVACYLMLRIVKQGKLYWFSIYCAIVGIIAIVVGLS